ncbi:MAG: hypothetical protein EG826_07525 [Deltaproteobacteria bacterium]|nr:hypothetical protein [Deltaproteobacteria bacterium]
MKQYFRIGFYFVLILGFAVSAHTQAAASGKINLAKIFKEPGFGYTIDLPPDWVYDIQPGKTIVFSGPSGTKAWFSTVSIQNLRSVKSGGKYADVNALINEFKAQLRAAGDTKFSDEEIVYYRKNNTSLQGKQFMAEYTTDKTRFKQWLIIIPRSNGDLFHAWFYTSPINQYNDFLDIAKAMLDSWMLIE